MSSDSTYVIDDLQMLEPSNIYFNRNNDNAEFEEEVIERRQSVATSANTNFTTINRKVIDDDLDIEDIEDNIDDDDSSDTFNDSSGHQSYDIPRVQDEETPKQYTTGNPKMTSSYFPKSYAYNNETINQD